MDMTLSALDAHLKRRGLTFTRQRGSHRHYHNALGQRLTVVANGSRFDWRQLAAIEADLRRLAATRAVGVDNAG